MKAVAGLLGCDRAAKSETRRPRSEGNPKSEARNAEAAPGFWGTSAEGAAVCQPQPARGPRSPTVALLLRISGFGFPSDFGLRISGFRNAGSAHARRRGTLQAWLALLCCGLAAGLLAQQPAIEEGRSRFGAVDIYVDSGSTPLAAYQLECAATNGVAKIVGVEGGEPTAFRQPPFYDPKAMQHERVILASFSTAPAADLPVGKARVATIHYQTTNTHQPQFTLKLQAVGDAQGNRISAQPSFQERKTQ
jgi:hypothetical protein